jgi:hypothetical protein
METIYKRKLRRARLIKCGTLIESSNSSVEIRISKPMQLVPEVTSSAKNREQQQLQSAKKIIELVLIKQSVI